MSAILFLLPAILGLALLLWSGQSTWSAYTRTKKNLILATAASPPAFVNLDEVNALPPLLKKYFQRVLEDGAPIIHHARLSQSGGFRAKPEQRDWSTMRAQQLFSCQPAGFVWDAKISLPGGFSIYVCDAYSAGRGSIRGKLLALFSVFDVQHRQQLDQAALQRYLAEAVWFPTALLPSQGVHWKVLDAQHAEATLKDGTISASLQFEFNDDGEIVSVFTPARFREVGGQFIPTPWRGHYSSYIKVDRYRVPQQAEVEWQLPERAYPYWKASLQEISYN